eukprot:scaffold308789_cov27-Tisochrysis_lutea.AAC.2
MAPFVARTRVPGHCPPRFERKAICETNIAADADAAAHDVSVPITYSQAGISPPSPDLTPRRKTSKTTTEPKMSRPA